MVCDSCIFKSMSVPFGSKQELHLSGQKYMMGAFLDCVAPFNCQGKKL